MLWPPCRVGAENVRRRMVRTNAPVDASRPTLDIFPFLSGCLLCLWICRKCPIYLCNYLSPTVAMIAGHSWQVSVQKPAESDRANPRVIVWCRWYAVVFALSPSPHVVGAKIPGDVCGDCTAVPMCKICTIDLLAHLHKGLQ